VVSNRNPVKAASNKVARAASRNQASRISNPDRADNRVAARGSLVSKIRDKAARTASTNKAPAVAGVFHARPSVGVTECRGERRDKFRGSYEKRPPVIAHIFCAEHFRNFLIALLSGRFGLRSSPNVKLLLIGLSSFQDKSAVKGTNVH
jgi:hypothetical protein